MRVQVLGSAAAEAIPALWCECPHCRMAREVGGKELRRRTCYWVDEDTLVDFGPDINWQVNAFGIDLLKIKNVLITHAHEDHLSPIEFDWRSGYCRVSHDINLVATAPSFARMQRVISEDQFIPSLDALHIRGHRVNFFEPIQLEDLEVLPLPACHAPGLNPAVFVLTRGQKSVFICNDTGMLPATTLDRLAGRQLDLVFMDATMGVRPGNAHHMNFADVIAFKQELERRNLLAPGAQCFANHFSHNSCLALEKMAEIFAPYNIIPAWDGMVATCD